MPDADQYCQALELPGRRLTAHDVVHQDLDGSNSPLIHSGLRDHSEPSCAARPCCFSLRCPLGQWIRGLLLPATPTHTTTDQKEHSPSTNASSCGHTADHTPNNSLISGRAASHHPGRYLKLTHASPAGVPSISSEQELDGRGGSLEDLGRSVGEPSGSLGKLRRHMSASQAASLPLPSSPLSNGHANGHANGLANGHAGSAANGHAREPCRGASKWAWGGAVALPADQCSPVWRWAFLYIWGIVAMTTGVLLT